MPETHPGVPDAEIEATLAGLGAWIAWPSPDLAPAVRRRIEAGAAGADMRARSVDDSPGRSIVAGRGSGSWRRPILPRRLLAAAAVCAALGALVAAVPAARRAVADRLGVPGILIRYLGPGEAPKVPQAPTVDVPAGDRKSPSAPSPSPRRTTSRGPALSGLGERISWRDAVLRAGFGVRRPDPAVWGEPDAVLLDAGAVTLVYGPEPRLPEADATGVGLLVTQFQADFLDVRYGKGVVFEKGLAATGAATPPTSVESVVVGGSPGYWISGGLHPLIRYVDREGEWREDSIRLAGNTLLWSEDGVTFRLESALERDAAIAIAERMRDEVDAAGDR